MSEQNKNHQETHEAFKIIVRHLVETIGFSEVKTNDEIWSNCETIVTAVNFYGSRAGRLKLECSSSAAWSLRDASLGDSQRDQSTKASAGEVVSELGTIISGRFLSAVDPLSGINLATPTDAGHSGGRVGDLGNQQVWPGPLFDFGNLTASVEFDGDSKSQE
jgi:hypothetical protein